MRFSALFVAAALTIHFTAAPALAARDGELHYVAVESGARPAAFRKALRSLLRGGAKAQRAAANDVVAQERISISIQRARARLEKRFPPRVHVYIDRPGIRVIPALAAQNNVRWHIHTARGTPLAGFVVMGAYDQWVFGLPEGVPELADPSMMGRSEFAPIRDDGEQAYWKAPDAQGALACTDKPIIIDSEYRMALLALLGITGSQPASAQSAETAKSFTIDEAALGRTLPRRVPGECYLDTDGIIREFRG